MSQSILKRCLELVAEDLPSSSKNTKKQNAKDKLKKAKKGDAGSVFEMIPERQRLTITTKVGKNQKKRK